MEELFAARDIDPDTRIYSETYHDLNGLPMVNRALGLRWNQRLIIRDSQSGMRFARRS